MIAACLQLLSIDLTVLTPPKCSVLTTDSRNSTPKILKDRELTEADRAAGVVIDREVVLSARTCNAKTVATDHPVRYLEIKVPAHVCTGRGGNNCDGRLRLVTNLMEVPAELIAEAYQLRWLIELLFRMMKQLLSCRHLLSTKHGGVEIQMYLSIIACLLILIYTGGHRMINGAPLPGQALVVLDPQRQLIEDMYPDACGHTQERLILHEKVEVRHFRGKSANKASISFFKTERGLLHSIEMIRDQLSLHRLRQALACWGLSLTISPISSLLCFAKASRTILARCTKRTAAVRLATISSRISNCRSVTCIFAASPDMMTLQQKSGLANSRITRPNALFNQG